MTSSTCNNTSSLDGVSAPYKLLKRYNAPVYFVKDLQQVYGILDDFRKLSTKEKVKLRTRLLEWNEKFKRSMKDLFIDKVTSLFDLWRHVVDNEFMKEL